MTTRTYYEPRENSDVELRLCLMCGEEYPADDLCPCLPTEPPVEEWDIRGDR